MVTEVSDASRLVTPFGMASKVAIYLLHWEYFRSRKYVEKHLRPIKYVHSYGNGSIPISFCDITAQSPTIFVWR